MKKLRLSALFLAAALLVTAVGSAALSNISFDRTVNAGTVLSDTNLNVAVKFEDTSNKPGFMVTSTAGIVSFNLNAFVSSGVGGFNANTTYTLGAANDGVFKVTNNTDRSIQVSLSGASKGLAMLPVTGGSTILTSGASSEYYFTLDTTGYTAETALTGSVHIIEAP